MRGPCANISCRGPLNKPDLVPEREEYTVEWSKFVCAGGTISTSREGTDYVVFTWDDKAKQFRDYKFHEVFSPSVVASVRAAARRGGLCEISVQLAIVLAALAARDRSVWQWAEKNTSLLGHLLKEVGGGRYDNRGRPRYVADFERCVVTVHTPDPGVWIGRQGRRIRPMREILRGIGWDIRIEAEQ